MNNNKPNSTRNESADWIRVVALIWLALQTGLSAAPVPPPGTLDTNFISGPGADGYVRVVAVQPDAKVLLGGALSTVRGVSNAGLTRLNFNGTPDLNFHSPFDPSDYRTIYTVAVLGDGRILAAGSFSKVGSTYRTNIARLNPDGSVDLSFDSGGVFAYAGGLVRILAVQPDQQILIGGEFTTTNRTSLNRIARLKPNGSLDLGFSPGTGADNTVRSVALQADGKVLVGGLFATFNGSARRFLARLNSNGSLDLPFPAGSGPDNTVYFVAPQPDGTIYITGTFTSVNGTAINGVARLRADGSLDPSFNPPSGAAGGAVYHLLRQANGKIVIGGAFTSVNGQPVNRFARLEPDGSLDPSFTPGLGPINDVLTLALQGDGEVVAGGLFASYDGVSVGQIARIHGDPIYPTLQVLPFSGGMARFSWPGWAAHYNLQATLSLVSPDWQPLAIGAAWVGDHFLWTQQTTNSSQFYRLTAP